MTNNIVGSIVSIWRYPVKSMAGEELTDALITDKGVQGDRAIALIDSMTGKIVSAKNPRKWPKLLHYRARLVEPASGLVIITCPDGTELRSDDPQTAARLSSDFGRPIVQQTVPSDCPILEVTGSEPGGTIVDEVIMAGTFFDAAPIHLVTTATMRRLQQLHSTGQFNIRRFRPNLVIDHGAVVGFAENNWIGEILAMGNDVRLRVTSPCPRCVMTTLDQPELLSDAGILRSAVEHNNGAIGVYATVLNGGTIRRLDHCVSI